MTEIMASPPARYGGMVHGMQDGRHRTLNVHNALGWGKASGNVGLGANDNTGIDMVARRSPTKSPSPWTAPTK